MVLFVQLRPLFSLVARVSNHPAACLWRARISGLGHGLGKTENAFLLTGTATEMNFLSADQTENKHTKQSETAVGIPFHGEESGS